MYSIKGCNAVLEENVRTYGKEQNEMTEMTENAQICSSWIKQEK